MLNPIHLTVRAAGLGLRAAVFTVKAVAIPVELGVRVAGAVCHRDDAPPEPWEGYAEMQVVDVLNRLSGADDATRAAVRHYELAHEHREAILHVTEG